MCMVSWSEGQGVHNSSRASEQIMEHAFFSKPYLVVQILGATSVVSRSPLFRTFRKYNNPKNPVFHKRA